MAYQDFKDLVRTTASDKVLHDKVFSIAKGKKYGRYQRSFATMVYKIYDKTLSHGAVKSEIILNQELAEKSHKQLLKNLKNEKYTHLL